MALANPKATREEWEKICKESDGQRILLTDELEKEGLAFQAVLEDHFQKTMAYNKHNAEFEHVKDNYFFNLRKQLEAAGNKEAFEIGLGFDQQAKADGILVINISKSK